MARRVVHGEVSDLYIYPVQGLSGQRLDAVTVDPAYGFPLDRCWTLPKRNGDYAKVQDRPLGLGNAYGLFTDPGLARVKTHLDTESERLRVYVQDHVVLDVSLREENDITRAENFFARVLDLDPADRPFLARRANRTYNFAYTALHSPHLMWACHVVNLATIRDLESRIDREIDPLRFRANLYVDFGEPWIERRLIGHEFRVGGVKVRGEMVTKRCAATEVNLETAERDIPIPRLLMQHYGHTELGIFANILTTGELRPGMPVELPASLVARAP